MAAALDAGITHFDTADAYGEGKSETYLGRLLANHRDRVVIATKFGWGDGPGDETAHGSPSAVRTSLEGSLRRLRTDRIDIYYYHRPDGITPLEDTLGALAELVDEGIIGLAACSNVDVALLSEAQSANAGGRLSAVQNEYNLLDHDAYDSILPWCRLHGIGFIPSRPLAQGLLTGKYRRNEPPPTDSRLQNRPLELTNERLAQVERLDAFAKGHGKTLLEVAIGALVSEAAVSSVIAGAMTADQVRANADAGETGLSAEELATLVTMRSP